jgi:glycine/D-amino acid oxidase-like deaminating enzyme
MKIVVIGAGAIGANIAYRLAVGKADVVVVDAARPASGTSAASIAYLSTFPQASWDEDPGRARLRLQLNDTFDQLQQEIGPGWLHWTGTLTWGLPEERAKIARDLAICRERGLDLKMLDGGKARGMAPGVLFADDDEVVYEARSGWVDAPAMVATLLDHVRKLGGSVLTDQPVCAVLRHAGKVTGVLLRDGSKIAADAVINAAGSWGSHIAALAGATLPLELVPGLVVYTEAIPGLPRQIIGAPTWMSRPDPEGGLAIHWRGEALTSVHGANGPSPQGILEDVAELIPALAGTAVAASRIGIRAIPHGGPVIGELPWLPGFYFAVSHGGVGWGPMWGRLAARELLEREIVPELNAMRPARFYIQKASFGRFADDAEQRTGA